ncbi:MAG: hypothetical protein QM662_19345, partial [Gordonia sp. (in: high G+C Gram-positive bacteria)]
PPRAAVPGGRRRWLAAGAAALTAGVLVVAAVLTGGHVLAVGLLVVALLSTGGLLCWARGPLAATAPRAWLVRRRATHARLREMSRRAG